MRRAQSLFWVLILPVTLHYFLLAGIHFGDLVLTSRTAAGFSVRAEDAISVIA